MITFITTLVLISNIAFVLFLLLFFINRGFRIWFKKFVQKHILFLLILSSLAAISGSLTFSNIIGFLPCDLCWVQRIFMYPTLILSFIAILRKEKQIAVYILSLSILGAIVATYHALIQWGFKSNLLGCTTLGGQCIKVYVNSYGYITIPFMSLSAFIYVITLCLVYLYGKE